MIPKCALYVDARLTVLNKYSNLFWFLGRGAYPSDILPYQMQVSESAAQVLSPESLLAEIRATAAEGLESGYTRIMRLCKCISQVV